MAYCENCGRQLSDQAVSCPNCGHPRTPARPAVGTLTSYADWWQRVVALIIDGIIIGVPTGIIVAVAGLSISVKTSTDQFGNPKVNSVNVGHFFGIIALAFLIGVLYRVLLEGGARGQTVGKMAMGIAVKDADAGTSIGYGRAFLRWLVATVLWYLFWLPGLLDVLFPLWDAKRQSIHDKAARSVVLKVS